MRKLILGILALIACLSSQAQSSGFIPHRAILLARAWELFHLTAHSY